MDSGQSLSGTGSFHFQVIIDNLMIYRRQLDKWRNRPIS